MDSLVDVVRMLDSARERVHGFHTSRLIARPQLLEFGRANKNLREEGGNYDSLWECGLKEFN